jgi:hypothetical protein
MSMSQYIVVPVVRYPTFLKLARKPIQLDVARRFTQSQSASSHSDRESSQLTVLV